MSNPRKKRFAFRPTVAASQLEDRVVLSTGVSVNPAVYVLTPPTHVASSGVTPAPAPSPISARTAALEMQPLTLARLRKDYRREVRIATRGLRNAIRAQVGQLYANGATPTAQQLADFNAGVAGAVNATALRLSVQASLLPRSGDRLVPAVQNAILGPGPRSLASRLATMAQSGQLSGSTGPSARALTRLLNTANLRTNAQLNTYFNSTPVNRLSVDSSGRRIPLRQYIGGQLINQAGNALGSLAQSFPTVANSMLFPNGTMGTVTPTQDALNAFSNQYRNALGTAAFMLGSGLSLFPRYSNVITQLQAPLFGGTGITSPGGSIGQLQSALPGLTGGLGTVGGLGGAGTTNSLLSALQDLQYGSSGFDASVSNAFGTAYQNLVTPIARYFGITGQTNVVLPSGGFTSLFGTPFTGNSFFNGFNNGFATGTTPGFVGFGTAPTGFSTGFGTGFNSFVANFNNGIGFNAHVGIGSGVNGIGSGAGANGGIGSGGGVNGGVGSGNLTGTGGGII